MLYLANLFNSQAYSDGCKYQKIKIQMVYLGINIYRIVKQNFSDF